MRRALSWDGIIPQKFRDWHPLSADEIRKVSDYVARNRNGQGSFEILCGRSTGGKKVKQASKIVQPYIDAGASWISIIDMLPAVLDPEDAVAAPGRTIEVARRLKAANSGVPAGSAVAADQAS